MPVLCFVIDTSASMNQRTAFGQRIIDQAKTAVENFISKVYFLTKNYTDIIFAWVYARNFFVMLRSIEELG
jgi:hypothetical protein